MTSDDFPLLFSAARSTGRLGSALESVATAVAEGQIRNVTLQETKASLSRAVEDAWRVHVAGPHFHGKTNGGSLSPEAESLYWSVSVYGLHDVISASKKVAASKATDAGVEAMRVLLRELLPLAEAVKGLKDKVLKGRAPAAPRPPANPDQLRLNCGCCFREVAVLGGDPTGLMAHHGYERPGEGFQTASCPGIRFMPLQTTDDGPRYMAGAMRRALVATEAALARAPALQTLSITVLEKGQRVRKEISPETREWPRAMDAHVKRLQGEIVGIRASIAHFDKVVAEWRPETEAALALVARRSGEVAQAAADPGTTRNNAEAQGDCLDLDAEVEGRAPGTAG